MDRLGRRRDVGPVEQPLDERITSDIGWRFPSLTYAKDKRPAQLEHLTDPAEVQPVIDETLEEIEAAGLRDRIRR